MLQSNAPPQDKAIVCKKLAICGNQEAVPALAALLADAKLAAWARIALEAIPDQAAGDALRNAAGKLQGRLLVGVINSIGVRRDAKAIDLLTQKVNDTETEVVAAAAVALGRIGGASGDQGPRTGPGRLASNRPRGYCTRLRALGREVPGRWQSGRGRETLRPGVQGRRAQAANSGGHPRRHSWPGRRPACRCWSNCCSRRTSLFSPWD